MRKVLSPITELSRIGGGRNSGCNGTFELTCSITGRLLFCMVSDGRDWLEPVKRTNPFIVKQMLPEWAQKKHTEIWGDVQEITLPLPVWEHVSVSAKIGLPRWDEMCWVKDQFWEPDEWVMQFHPAEKDYVNIHENVLHLWKPINVEIPHPPRHCV